MKINEILGAYRRAGIPRKLLMIMKLTTLIIMVSLLQVSALTKAQITLNEKSISMQKALFKISAQSGYDFVYSDKDLKNLKPISIRLENVGIQKALEVCFANLPLIYEVKENTVLIKKKEFSFLNQLLFTISAIDIRGIVLDEKGQPLPGATIKIKESKRMINTNENGEFQIDNVNENTILQISFLGYKTKEITVGQSRSITVKLELGISDLEEVAVVSTGYQTLSKERATGSFTTIGQEQLEKPSTNIAQRLIGTTAGMQATLDADGNPRFEIRGQTALNIRNDFGIRNQNAAPLVVVDGFAIQGDFNTINPNDVESVTVLKDAAAASIWGARSANGVIVIVTKKAKTGTPLNVNFSAFTRISKKLDLDYVNPLATASETVDYEIKSFEKWGGDINDGSFPDGVSFSWAPAGVALTEQKLGFISATQRDALLAKYRTMSNKDQIRDELLKNPTVQQYNLDISGSTAKMNNRLSLLFEDAQSNFKGSDNKKYTVNYHTDADIFKWLQLSFGGLVNYNKINRNGVNYNVNPYGAPNPLEDISALAPYEMLRNEDGSLTDLSRYYKPILERLVPTGLFPYADWSYNPIQEIANRKYKTEDLNLRLQAGLKFKLLKGLSVDTKVQYELANSFNSNYDNENTFEVRNTVNTAAIWDMTTNRITSNLPKGGILKQDRAKTEAYVFRNQINFDRKIGDDHEINFIGGSEINNVVYQTFGNPPTYGYSEQTLSVGTFPRGPGGQSAPILNWMGYPQVLPYSNKFSYTTDRYFSLFGNASYSYKNKYTLSGSIRTDASNLITDDPSYRYAPFWSVGFGWQLGKEHFLQQIEWVDRLSLRATYGYNGNVDRSTSFRPLLGMGAIPDIYTGDMTANVSSFGNPTLRWEKTGTWDLGLDYSLFKGQLYGKVDVYNKSGRDLIATLSIPAANGTTMQKLNNAAMTNRGIEVELGTMQKIKGNEITWHGNLNFSYNKNRITKLFVANYHPAWLTSGGSVAYVEGQDANTLWRFQYAGIKNNQPTLYGPNGDQFDFSAYPPGDGRDFLLKMGTEIAPYTLGFINSFKVYDFNLSFVVTGKFGHKFQRKGFNYPPSFTSKILPNKKITEVLNGDPMKIVPLPLNENEPRYYFWGRFTESLSYLIENASHIRMQEINLSYNLPLTLGSKVGMRRVQVFAQGNDLFTIVANKVGEDPEYPMGTLKPQPRISLGLKCEF
ncbi:SusC/RagA family TonB-linked outer membrane protein [Pedobacter sp. GR22-6]|uniref:SusC/RagA family TonB-linked outer membrane protein n=1 Tax=Pedobacter sp. GR22-6 TaxID=3127957 RepID=UPI00307ECEE5